MKQLIVLSTDHSGVVATRSEWVAKGAQMSADEYLSIKADLQNEQRRASLQGPERDRDERYLRFYDQWIEEQAATVVMGASEQAALKVSDMAFARNLEVGEIVDGERFIGVVIGPDQDTRIDALLQEAGALLQSFDPDQ
jgi:hypothetical protein